MATFYYNGNEVSRTYALNKSLHLAQEYGSDINEALAIFKRAEQDNDDGEYARDDIGNVTNQEIEVVI